MGWDMCKCSDPPKLVHRGGKWWQCSKCRLYWVDNGVGLSFVGERNKF